MPRPLRRASGRLAAMMLVTATSAAAADSDGRFAIDGAGLQTCERFLADWEQGSRNVAIYAGWIEGYVTAQNQRLSDTFDLTPWQTAETLLGMMKRYCELAPPETRFFDRVLVMLQEISPLRLQAASPLSGARRGPQGVIVYDSVITSVRARLDAEGFGPFTQGEGFTDELARALEAFQSARGLEVTGLPDQKTLFTLFHVPSGAAVRP